MPRDPLSRPPIDIARELPDRRASARELVEAAIARHKRFGERLHAYSFWAPEQARAVADVADAAFAAGVSAGPLQELPVSVPGCRAPHVWLEGRRSLYDAIGQDYTLLRLDPTAHISGIVAAAAQRGLPLAVLDARSREASQ